jgi:hypothetical protein
MMYADAKAECEAFAVRDMGSLKAQNTFTTRKVEA